MNFTQARINMITQQIRAWGVTDERILNLYKILPREDFVSQQYRELAFADTTLPVGGGEFTMPPKEEARTLQALKLSNKDKVLEIGV